MAHQRRRRRSRAASSGADRVRRIYDRLAPSYDRFMRVYDRLLVGDGRRWIASRARGRVLEVGVGSGLNLAHYPREARVTGIDLSPAMLALARERARRAGVAADLAVGDAESLPYPDASFDSVVMVLVLSSIPDARRALAEARRVLRPSGRMLILDHGRGRDPFFAGVQRVAGALTARVYADRRDRDPGGLLLAAGFTIEERESVAGGLVERLAARAPA